jgi:RNA polymerase-associated protein CTR9
MAVTEPPSKEGVPASDEDSLIIPITSGSGGGGGSEPLFIEIFPEELKDTPVTTLLRVLQSECPNDLDVWADAALCYMQEKHTRESLALLEAACDCDRNVRVLAATGIAVLAAGIGEDSRNAADQKFSQAAAMDTFFPMTWMGRGMLNLSYSIPNRDEQAKFFFNTTLKECGPVLPGLLGIAAVHYAEGKFGLAQSRYAEAIRRYPDASNGASARVGFGFCCYRLGQVDRARAAFDRALALDPENVQAMVGAAILDMAAGDSTEQAIKRLSMANLLNHNSAMVQNHLANHYFWKWTAVTGTVSAETGSDVVTTHEPMPLDVGDPVQMGTKFETTIVRILDEDGVDPTATKYRLAAPWKEPTAAGLKVWKKDYERVFALAKGAYSSTSVPEIQAESLFFLARVYHVREDSDNAFKFYDKACKLAPNLTPARFGLAQTLVVQEKYDEAAKQLRQLLGLAASNATDAYALLGLLEVRAGQIDEGLAHLRKAIELDPANPDLIVLEALALQQQRAHYGKALDRYKKAIDLMKRQKKVVPFEIYTNSGVLCHETKNYEEALSMYKLALAALDEDGEYSGAQLENTGMDGARVVHPDNDMFCAYVATGVQASLVDGTNQLKLVGVVDASACPVAEGDAVRLGESFVTEIGKIEEKDGDIVVELNDTYDPMSENGPISVAVKRENKLLDIVDATTVAFNIARLHEAAGKTLAAIELHKAIARRNPAYVNSYLRLACIAVDCGSLTECAQWLKIAAASAPGNSEVLTLIGNLHLSLCDWKPAQKIFDGLMAQKIASVEAYSALSMGNIYFENLSVSEERYAKHLQYASDYYKRILGKDPLNAYAANGIGTVLAEKAEIFKAKEIFNRVREVSEDSIADALLNLGHIYLAQKKHPEALQLYKSYLKRAEDGTTPVTSKSRTDDIVDVLLYIAFAYFDWARHTELSHDINAAPADGRYKGAMHHLELAIRKQSKKDIILRYNLCMTKLQAANCVLQKLTRNIPRTVEEVEEALIGLEESLKIVEGIVEEKEKGEKKINIRTSTLEDFLKHCRANITSAQSHLEDEKKRAAEERDDLELRRLAAEAAQKEAALKEAIRKQEEAKRQEERDQRADAKMKKVEELSSNWKQEQEAAESKGKKAKAPPAPELEEDGETGNAHGLFDDSSDEESDADESGKRAEKEDGENKGAAPSQNDLFGDSDDSADEGKKVKEKDGEKKDNAKAIFGDSDSDEDVFESSTAADIVKDTEPTPATTSKDLFGDSDDESDEELVPVAGAKRSGDEDEEEQPAKKQKVAENAEE